jgi:hypothetical protein
MFDAIDRQGRAWFYSPDEEFVDWPLGDEEVREGFEVVTTVNSLEDLTTHSRLKGIPVPTDHKFRDAPFLDHYDQYVFSLPGHHFYRYRWHWEDYDDSGRSHGIFCLLLKFGFVANCWDLDLEVARVVDSLAESWETHPTEMVVVGGEANGLSKTELAAWVKTFTGQGMDDLRAEDIWLVREYLAGLAAPSIGFQRADEDAA